MTVKTPQVKDTQNNVIDFDQNESVILMKPPKEFDRVFEVEKIDGTIGYIYKGHIDEKYGECLKQDILTPGIIRANDANSESDTDIDLSLIHI